MALLCAFLLGGVACGSSDSSAPSNAASAGHGTSGGGTTAAGSNASGGSSTSGGSSNGGSSDGGQSSAAGGPLGEPGAGNGPHATVRVADFSEPDLLYLDVCFSTDALGATTAWEGPMLKNTYQSISHATLSPYFDVRVDTQSIRFVLANTSDCQNTVEGVPDFALTTPLAADTRSTIALGGTAFHAGTRDLQIFQYLDEVVAADGPNSVRFLNFAQAETSVDIYTYMGFGSKPPCTQIIADVPYGGVGQPIASFDGSGAIDANGYIPLAGKGLYDITFSETLGFTAHGTDCATPFATLYSTDGELEKGAWTFFFYDDGATRVICRDDGTPNPLCDFH